LEHKKIVTIANGEKKIKVLESGSIDLFFKEIINKIIIISNNKIIINNSIK
jgi:adenine deaminase